ncbi:DUF3592 domain-containing protein [Sphingomonas donggukensis]|uniref:DUF3592 domain-containing protein n=1 Tax=Sphingomonas donggukensis TaxID=2949093 RepID=A0ABY4TRL8_9SPHN|nr:DUF3592 domain-containing protein [Sphingomonas donggukensis]URW74887.1 DUF3592 domain-containing protein [Sphingomonas donggukensis]
MLQMGLVLVGMGVLVAGVWRWLAWRGRARSYGAWPSVDAAIVASSLRARMTLDDDNREVEYWEPQVRYRYAVDGAEFEGRRARWFDAPFQARDEADRWLDAHGAGTAVRAYYDPARPASSALELNPPVSAPGTGMIWIGGALMIGALLAAGGA